MRNWNPQPPVFIWHTELLLRAYLWGIETIKKCYCFINYIWLRAYLWGIETQRACNVGVIHHSVASLPMRNWNTLVLTGSNNCFTGCEPTYEELKPSKLEACFSWEDKVRAYLWGIETYCIHCGTPPPGCVASLPMRNWNWAFVFHAGTYEAVASLPMRNWNKDFLTCPEKFKLGCEPTYEELKQVLADESLFNEFSCEPTYEELKRGSMELAQGKLEKVASLPMRNWN